MTQRVQFKPKKCRLADGSEVLFRLIEETDGPLLLELFYTLSPQSIYHRFLTPVKEVRPEQLRRFVEIDQWTEVALAACMRDGERWRIVGVGRYHLGPGEKEAEVALVVGDPWQGKGIGGLLMRLLAKLAKTQGVERFSSTVDPSNIKLMRFCEFYGYQTTKRYEGGLIRVEADIASLGRGPGGKPHPKIKGTGGGSQAGKG